MCRRSLILAMLAVWGGFQIPAQAPPPHPPHGLAGLFGQAHHAPPAPKNPVHTPEADFDATSLGEPITLDKNWRVGVTSNPDAALPGFDDSTWSLRDARDAIPEVSDEDHIAGDDGTKTGPPDRSGKPDNHDFPAGHGRPFVWFRIHVKLAPNHGPVALLLELPVSHNASLSLGSQGPSVDVWANGKKIQPQGPHGDSPEHYQTITRIYNLDVPSSETSLVLVVQSIYIPFGYGSYTSFFANRKFHLGNLDDLNRSLDLWNYHSLFERLPRLINSILLAILAVFLLALYFTQKGHPEYLWLALHELVQAPIGFVDLEGATAQLDQFWYAAVVLQLVVISAYLYFEFLISFLSLRPRWYIRVLRYGSPILIGVAPTLLMIGHGRSWAIALVVVYAGSFIWLTGWAVFCFSTLIISTLRRNYEAGVLLIPLILSIVGIIEPIVTSGMNEWSGHEYHSPLTIQAGPIPIHFASIADFFGLLAIVLIIFTRFLRIQRDQERASSELEAARSVQELMIPQEKLNTPGFEVDSVYNPANEVGGDFYHVEPTSDGGLLVVLGDVAGKGLKAAMNVSMLVGALRRISDQGPAKILESLNRVLVGTDSFATCMAAWFGPNGEIVLSNAGHLPPYLNSQEITLPGSLPLGVLDGTSYDEVQLYLHPGDRILLLSDGVVEARQPSGELFGFNRVHNLSNQSAFYIADAAKAFGQEDDITVLTVRRLATAIAA